MWKWQLVILIVKEAKSAERQRRVPLSLTPGIRVGAEGGESNQSVGFEVSFCGDIQGKR